MEGLKIGDQGLVFWGIQFRAWGLSILSKVWRSSPASTSQRPLLYLLPAKEMSISSGLRERIQILSNPGDKFRSLHCIFLLCLVRIRTPARVSISRSRPSGLCSMWLHTSTRTRVLTCELLHVDAILICSRPHRFTGGPE